jgi:hypothetical protein
VIVPPVAVIVPVEGIKIKLGVLESVIVPELVTAVLLFITSELEAFDTVKTPVLPIVVPLDCEKELYALEIVFTLLPVLLRTMALDAVSVRLPDVLMARFDPFRLFRLFADAPVEKLMPPHRRSALLLRSRLPPIIVVDAVRLSVGVVIVIDVALLRFEIFSVVPTRFDAEML